MYSEVYYELCEGGREEIGAKIPQVSPKEIWGEEVNKKIEASLQIANNKKEKEKEWRVHLISDIHGC